MIGFAAVVEPMLAGRGINGHAADGIAYLVAGRSFLIAVAGVIVTSAAAPRLCRVRWSNGRGL